MRLVKNDEYVKDLTHVGQLAALKKLVSLIGEKNLSPTMYHFETLHGHIVEIRLNEQSARANHVGNMVELSDLAKLEQNSWVRFIAFCRYSTGSISIGLKRA